MKVFELMEALAKENPHKEVEVEVWMGKTYPTRTTHICDADVESVSQETPSELYPIVLTCCQHSRRDYDGC